MGPDLTWYLAVAAFLFAIGALGVMLRRSPLIVLLSLEIMLNGANLALITFSRHHGGARRADLRARGDGRRRFRGRRRPRPHRRRPPPEARPRRRQAVDAARMSDVRLIQVPYYLGREHASLSRGPAKLADAIEGESIVDRVAPARRASERGRRVVFGHPRSRLGRARDSRGRTLPARPRRQLLHLARDRGRARPRRRRRLVRRPRRLPHARHDDEWVLRRNGARHAARRRLARASEHRRGTAARARGARRSSSAPATSTRRSRSRSTPRRLRRADAQTLDAALDELSGQVDAVYVHVDLDVIDPSVARANALSVARWVRCRRARAGARRHLEPLRDRCRRLHGLRPERRPRESRSSRSRRDSPVNSCRRKSRDDHRRLGLPASRRSRQPC